MNTPQSIELTRPWRKSSYCDTGGQCVEIAQAGAHRLVRDSKYPAGAFLAFSTQVWAAFISDIKHGAYRADRRADWPGNLNGSSRPDDASACPELS
jgi:hypothetical protein